MTKNAQTRPFGIRDKLGYLLGDFGNDFTFILSTMVLMKFYTDVVGISAGAVGTIMMLARFVDAFTDVTMGRICDRSRVIPGAGKFRPWLLRMCVPVAATSFLMYLSGIARWPYALKVGYLLVTYILWGSICYTAVNIPYGSMASTITGDPGERQSLSTYRSMGAALAGTVIGVLVPVFAYEKVHGVETMIGWRVTLVAGIFSLLAVAAYVACYVLTRERITPASADATGQRQPVIVMLREAAGNRSLISIVAASVVMLLAQLTMQNMGGYIFPDYYNQADAQSVSTVLMLLGMLLAAALAKPLSARFGKAEVAALANLFAGLVSAATYVLRPASVWVFVGLQMLGWIGLGLFSMVSWALITDVIDDSEVKKGVREDGSIYAMYSFARKLGQAAAAGVTGWLLTAIGYVPGAAGGQTQDVLSGIFAIATLVPALGFVLLAAVLWWWYPLHKRKVEENSALLHRRHEQVAQAD